MRSQHLHRISWKPANPNQRRWRISMKRWLILGLMIELVLTVGCTRKPGKEGEACDEKKRCEQQLRCVDAKCCQPQCQGKFCGDDGCGTPCGTCEAGTSCQDGQCKCVPNCEGKKCGDDGCGGLCGKCAQEETCANGACVSNPSKAAKPGKAAKSKKETKPRSASNHQKPPKKSRKK